MGHIVFIFLHLIAIILGFWMLIITIPLHLIYAIASSGRKELKEQVEELKEQTKIRLQLISIQNYNTEGI